MPRYRCEEHGLEYNMFYVQKRISHLAACTGPAVVCNRLLGAPAFVKLTYCVIRSYWILMIHMAIQIGQQLVHSYAIWKAYCSQQTYIDQLQSVAHCYFLFSGPVYPCSRGQGYPYSREAGNLCSRGPGYPCSMQSSYPWNTGNTLAKSHILGGVRASVPRSTIITQGRQAITESRGRYWVHNFFKPFTHKQKHRNWRISTQNVKNMLKLTPITVSLPGDAVLRHNCTHDSLTLLWQRLEYFRRIRSTPWSLMPWFYNELCWQIISRHIFDYLG